MDHISNAQTRWHSINRSKKSTFNWPWILALSWERRALRLGHLESVIDFWRGQNGTSPNACAHAQACRPFTLGTHTCKNAGAWLGLSKVVGSGDLLVCARSFLFRHSDKCAVSRVPHIDEIPFDEKRICIKIVADFVVVVTVAVLVAVAQAKGI